MKTRFSPLLTLIALSLLLSLDWRFVASSVAAQTDQRRLEQKDAVTALPGQAKRWALVIGVDQYRDSQISRLKGADNDAKMLAEALTRYAGFPADQVVLLATDQPEERQPTRVNILRRLSNLRTVVPKDGLLLVSFAGHGLERGGHAYLLPTDAQYSDDIALVEQTALGVIQMKDSIRAIGVQQVIVLLDACRNDPVGRGVGGNRMSAAYRFDFDLRNREVTAFATLYATAVGQLAYEFSEKRQGYFTWAIVEALKGAAVNAKGEVTLATLLRYVQEAVPKRVGIDLGAGKQQKPFAVIEGYLSEDLVIAYVPKLNVPLNVPTMANSASAESQDWQKIKDSKDPEQFREFLRKYPNSQFAGLARNRLAALQPAPPQPTPQVERCKQSQFFDVCLLEISNKGQSVNVSLSISNRTDKEIEVILSRVGYYECAILTAPTGERQAINAARRFTMTAKGREYLSYNFVLEKPLTGTGTFDFLLVLESPSAQYGFFNVPATGR